MFDGGADFAEFVEGAVFAAEGGEFAGGGGHFKFYWQPDIRLVGNPMDGHGYDLDIPEEWKK